MTSDQIARAPSDTLSRVRRTFRFSRAWRSPVLGTADWNRGLDAWSDRRYYRPMKLEFTAVFRPVPGGFVGYVEELPGANTQGATLEETRTNLEEAVALVLEANRAAAREDAAGIDVIREPLRLTA